MVDADTRGRNYFHPTPIILILPLFFECLVSGTVSWPNESKNREQVNDIGSAGHRREKEGPVVKDDGHQRQCDVFQD